ncbi:DUF523 and DUF1722 domain-containing protein [Catenovulum sp. 2E275]|uniref:YbgA family protein n=1 Tax=Catenovulum sp. 2E275 TaxID=2980497 RepID=UPI0021D2D644|nr:DUF523 and DUF1722 domain-containing protein [Catenovulum sp. 2E275]MCU4674630.1 DUF523 and DUF1722 domain-containing protein [Catenovulum sp. 2E275]
MTNTQKLNIGISACLLGEKVRFDGGHKALTFANQTLSQYVNFKPVCPEVGIGMSVPRKPIRLVETQGDVKLLDSRDNQLDYTDKMLEFSTRQCSQLTHLNGFILTSKSPSCGMERMKVYDEEGNLQHRKGVGLFAKTLMQMHPNLPVEEDGRLNDAALRENFISRIFVHANWHQTVAQSDQIKDLIAFHSNHKYQIMAHSYQAYKNLGKLVANQQKLDFDTLKQMYFSQLMQSLKNIAGRKKHCNVLMHLQGYFKRDISAQDKQELNHLILHYRQGLVPLLAPLTLIKHFLKLHPNEYLAQQTYFNPYPLEMGLNG